MLRSKLKDSIENAQKFCAAAMSEIVTMMSSGYSEVLNGYGFEAVKSHRVVRSTFWTALEEFWERLSAQFT